MMSIPRHARQQILTLMTFSVVGLLVSFFIFSESSSYPERGIDRIIPASSTERQLRSVISNTEDNMFATEDESLDVFVDPRHRGQVRSVKERLKAIEAIRNERYGQLFVRDSTRYNATIMTALRFSYLMEEKGQPYVGNENWYVRYPKGSRKWLNSMAVFPGATDHRSSAFVRQHGILGVDANNKSLWIPDPRPPPVRQSVYGYDQAMRNGGFYLNLTNALPLDRPNPDFREDICKAVRFNRDELPDASVVITFYNEPLSTLLRTVHSVLNTTPPPLLREVLLVDDHSNSTECLPGGPLYEHIKFLPKTKLMRLGQRKGLVHARLAGAHAATGQVLVILDSHVEVNTGWLEPLLDRIRHKPDTIIFPQILSIDPETFDYDPAAGIGCRVSFKWSMVEQSSLSASVRDVRPSPSPSMAGGLFAVDLDYFWHIGGYDEEFLMWGSENVEMGFRTWLCGGTLECAPCSKTYHVYRKKGSGYETPGELIIRNKLRAARLWTDQYFPIAKLFISPDESFDMGNFDKMLELKHRLKCKPFDYFLETVDPGHDITSLSDIERSGEVRHTRLNNLCLDSMSNNEAGRAYGIYPCHGQGGTQSWVLVRTTRNIIPVNNERLCMAHDGKFAFCKAAIDPAKIVWDINEIEYDQVQFQATGTDNCLGINDNRALELIECDSRAIWTFKRFVKPHFTPLKFTEQYLKKQRLFYHREKL